MNLGGYYANYAFVELFLHFICVLECMTEVCILCCRRCKHIQIVRHCCGEMGDLYKKRKAEKLRHKECRTEFHINSFLSCFRFYLLNFSFSQLDDEV